MTDKDVLAAGYKEYQPTKFDHSHIEKCFQKRFDDENGKKYFIDIKKWGEMTHPYTGETWPPSYEFHVQLCNHDDEPVNMEFFSGWSIDKVEQYVEALFQTGLFKHYERWDEE